MKTLITTLMIFIFTVSLAQSQTNNKYKEGFWDVSPSGGFILPLGTFADNYKASPRAGIDISYRVNKEVGIYGNFTYNALQNKNPQAPSSSYMEATVGPRYYFMHPKLKSSFFLEGGVGAYIFNSDAYTITMNGTEEIPASSDTKVGVNTGFGGTLNLSENLDIFIRSKYNMIFTTGGTSSFLSNDGGLTIRF